MPTTLTNLVVNPSIETATTDWTANGGATLTRVSTQQQSGAWSLQVACTAVADSGTQCAAITAGVGATFSAGVYLRGNVGGETVDVQLRNQAGTVITTLPATLTTAWQRFTISGVTPGSTTSVHVRINKTAATAHTYFLDAAMVTAGTVWPYFDGDTPGASWSGTAHASASTIQVGSAAGIAAYDYHIDWSGTEFGDAADDVSSRLIGSDPVSVQYGRDSERALSPTTSVEASFTLDNTSRDYSPDNASSPLVVRSGRQARIQATINAVTYVLIRGFVDDFTLDPRAKSVSFTLTDARERLFGQRAATSLYQGLRTGEAIGVLLDAVGWPTADRDIDVGATVMPWWWAEGDAGDELQKLVTSEGPTAFCAIGSDGKFMFRDRHHRLLRAASFTSQTAVRVTGSGTWDPLASWPMGYDHGAKAIVNDVTFAVGRRVVSPELTQVWTSEETVTVTDGQTVEIAAQTSEPFWDAVTPVSGVDFTATGGGTPTMALTRVSGQSTTIRILSTGGPATIQGLALRAYAVPVVHTVQIHEEDPASRDIYGRRSWPNEAPWVGVHDAKAIGQIVLAHRADRLPTVSVTLKNYNDLVLIEQLSREVSDRITILDAEIGIDDDFFIEQITHQIHGSGERVHETTFACEKVPTQVSDVFILGSATRGVLGTNRLGKAGLDDPATVFILGSGTNGVLGTSLLGR